MQIRPGGAALAPCAARRPAGFARRTVQSMIVLATACATGQTATPPARLSRAAEPGPWNGEVQVFRIDPAGEAVRTATFQRAGVASVARMRDGRLIVAHQHFPENDEASFDKVAVRFSSDEARTWTGPQVIRLAGLPRGMRFPFDPTLVPLPDGRVRLYFTSLRGRRFEEDTPAIFSAISDNGVDYTFELGTRFGIEGRLVIDCAVVLHRGVFHLYAPDNGPSRRIGKRPRPAPVEHRPPGVAYHATSRDGLNFTRIEDVRIEGPRHWLGGARDPDQAGFPDADAARRGVWMAASSDGQVWKILPALSVPVADPGIAAARDGGWIVVGTSGAPGFRAQRGIQNPRPPVLPLMAALDANRDGVLDKKEIENASAALKALDANGDGKITREEMGAPSGRPASRTESAPAIP